MVYANFLDRKFTVFSISVLDGLQKLRSCAAMKPVHNARISDRFESAVDRYKKPRLVTGVFCCWGQQSQKTCSRTRYDGIQVSVNTNKIQEIVSLSY